VAKRVVGQEVMVERLLIGLLTVAMCCSKVCRAREDAGGENGRGMLKITFSRIQFTPDLLPADVIARWSSTSARRSSIPKRTAVANLVLADEINRAPAKVQSALLEAMQEKQVTIGGETFSWRAVLVLATQNPIEHEGPIRCPKPSWSRSGSRPAPDMNRSSWLRAAIVLRARSVFASRARETARPGRTLPPIVTCFSCIASSSADWTLAAHD